MKPEVKVLFVCLGNICRSPMAEAIMRSNAKGLNIQSDSAGTAGYHIGEAPHQGTRKILKKNGISYDGIKARKLTYQDGDDFDYIIAMDTDNLRDIEEIISKSNHEKLHLLSEYSKGNWSSVPDPWYTGDFQETYDLVSDGVEGLIEYITAESSISYGKQRRA